MTADKGSPLPVAPGIGNVPGPARRMDAQPEGVSDAALPVEETSPSAEPAAVEENSYGQILKSSALIGGSSVAIVAVGIIRTKAMAVLLGPAGFGLMGLYGSIVDLVLSITSLGIGSSGVRQIAESVASGDTDRIGRTAVVLRRTAIALGVLGMVLTVAFAKPLSVLTFGSPEHADAVALLSLAVFFRAVAAGQGALIQGMRRIADLAKLGIIGAVLGAPIAIGLVWLFGERGVAPSLVAVAAVGLAISWWYSRKVPIRPPTIRRSEMTQEAASLLKLGFAFMASGVLMMGAAYAVRTIVLRMEGLEAAGFYSAAWTLGGLYVGIILQAMGADFYPRLVGAVTDHPRCNRLVNEQTRISLLLAGPGVIATLTFAFLVITIFYSANFAGAVEVLRWFCLGIALRVITWPIGFIIVAKNQRSIFLGTEVAWTVVNVGLTWLCVGAFGLNGAGIAFFASYVFHALMIYPIVHKLTGFRWSAENVKTGLMFLSSIAVVFGGFYVLPPVTATAWGILVMVLSGIYSLRTLLAIVPTERIPQPIRQFLVRFRLV
jgi:enterobacterial common antigen flippase